MFAGNESNESVNEFVRTARTSGDITERSEDVYEQTSDYVRHQINRCTYNCQKQQTRTFNVRRDNQVRISQIRMHISDKLKQTVPVAVAII